MSSDVLRIFQDNVTFQGKLRHYILQISIINHACNRKYRDLGAQLCLKGSSWAGGMQNSCSVQLTVDDYRISVCVSQSWKVWLFWTGFIVIFTRIKTCLFIPFVIFRFVDDFTIHIWGSLALVRVAHLLRGKSGDGEGGMEFIPLKTVEKILWKTWGAVVVWVEVDVWHHLFKQPTLLEPTSMRIIVRFILLDLTTVTKTLWKTQQNSNLTPIWPPWITSNIQEKHIAGGALTFRGVDFFEAVFSAGGMVSQVAVSCVHGLPWTNCHWNSAVPLYRIYQHLSAPSTSWYVTYNNRARIFTHIT